MSKAGNEWMPFYRAVHILEANALKEALELEQIQVRIEKGANPEEGTLSPEEFIEILLLIREQDKKKATMVIESYQQRQGIGWYCSCCGEFNRPHFEVCWRCKHEPGEAAD
ncbi:bL32 family ribosomal protein [Dongshaea marina]|uniref:ribosomal protein L32 n=1 Tax=Dongshaea marina TaxID=2047966 RepID=UPI000D3EC808|nr:ribosomal protein L32 [Dongshaea marina]